ncbi:MAG: family 20 glycosylhydrolase [Planctomycetota bacterium]
MKRCLIHYDVNRGRIPKLETVYRHVEILEKWGLDGILFYIECVIDTSVFPACGCGSTPLTHDYIQELSAFLKQKKMDFIPLVQILGHQEHLLEKTEMQEHAESAPDGHSFRIDSKKTRKKVKEWLTEIVPLFNSEYFHVGCDEVWDIGLGKSRQYVNEMGYEEAVADYLNEMTSFISSLGKKPVIYADLIIHYPGLRDLLNKDIIICNWGYGSKTDIYEQENHNFAMHEFVTSGRRNWVTGNNMAEYIITPFKRLEDNVSVWQEIGGKSKAEVFLISDWGSYENVNPFILSIIGDIYILKQIKGEGCSLDDLLEEVSCLILGSSNTDFKDALRILLAAQQNEEYFGTKLNGWGPVFPAFLYDDPASKGIIRRSACLEKEGIEKFTKDSEKAVNLLQKISTEDIPNPDFLEDLQVLSRRMLIVALRIRLCFDYTWNPGSIWISKEDAAPAQQRLSRYIELANLDLDWYMSKWDQDNLRSCREKCRAYMTRAIESTCKTVNIPENSMLYYKPDKHANSILTD